MWLPLRSVKVGYPQAAHATSASAPFARNLSHVARRAHVAAHGSPLGTFRMRVLGNGPGPDTHG
jgi:hypothetical protein